MGEQTTKVLADRLAKGEQLQIGTLVLLADDLWRQAGWMQQLRVWLFGRRRDVVHLGTECRLHWWRGQPYLISIREAD